MLQKIRTLAVQSANGTNTKEDRDAIKAEAQSALMAEITRIAKDTKFGGKTFLLVHQAADSIYDTTAQNATNKAGKMTLQVGANNKDDISFSVGDFRFRQHLSAAIAGNAIRQHIQLQVVFNYKQLVVQKQLLN